jgi:hypothetical protein
MTKMRRKNQEKEENMKVFLKVQSEKLDVSDRTPRSGTVVKDDGGVDIRIRGHQP